MPTFAGRPSTMSSTMPLELPQNPKILWLDSKDSTYRSCNSTNSLIHNRFWCGIRFKNPVAICSDFPSEAMLWIKEVEMVDSLEQLKSSRSASGKNFPNFEMLDAKIASALNKNHPEVTIQEEGQPRGAENPERGSVSTRKRDRFHDLRLLLSDWRS